MSDWTGLDPGGTEQLFEPSVLINALEVFKRHEPFSRNNADSPIFADLEDLYPDITWKNYDAQGSFRPIFRKTNPWAKLGLITPDTVDIVVTPSGDELLASEKTISQVFIDATKHHREPDGTASFSTMCKAATTLPEEVFTLEDVEYAISKTYQAGTESLEVALRRVRSSRTTFPSGSRRKRTLQSFMNALVTAGALSYTDTGWLLNDLSIATEIAGQARTSVSSGIRIDSSTDAVAGTESQRQTRNFRPIVEDGRTTPSYNSSDFSSYDPIRRALLLEKANGIHESLVRRCASIIRALQKTPIEDSNSFDVAVEDWELIIEVKSINRANAVSQLRKAVAQLPEYRWRYKSIFSTNSVLIIITNENPASYVDNDFIDYLKQDRSLHLFWLDGENLRNAEGDNLQDFLTRLQ